MTTQSKSIRLTPSQLLINGKKALKRLPLLGKGAFSYVYYIQEEGADRALIASCDPLKEAYSLGWMPKDTNEDTQWLFPQDVRKIDCFDDGNYQLYSMPLYVTTGSLKECLKPEAYAIYKVLREIAEKGHRLSINKPFHVWDFVKMVQQWEGIDEALREGLIDALETLGNFSDEIGIEVSPRNVAIKDGRLVLLDIFYDKKTLRKIRQVR